MDINSRPVSPLRIRSYSDTKFVRMINRASFQKRFAAFTLLFMFFQILSPFGSLVQTKKVRAINENVSSFYEIDRTNNPANFSKFSITNLAATQMTAEWSFTSSGSIVNYIEIIISTAGGPIANPFYNNITSTSYTSSYTFTGLSPNTEYFFQIIASRNVSPWDRTDAFIGSASVPIGVKYTIPDTTEPTIVSLGYSPVLNATDVAIDSNIEITFSENIKWNDQLLYAYQDDKLIDIRKILPYPGALTTWTDANHSGVTVSGNKLILNPPTNMSYGAHYAVEISNTAICDLANNCFGGLYGSTEYHFTTVAGVTTFTVTYNGNGNSGGTVPIDSGSYIYNQAAIALGNTGSLVKTGYTFTGWNTATNGLGTDRTVGATFPVYENTSLYAKWTANTNTITFNGNGNTGGSTAAQNIATNASAALTSNGFTKTGYTFAGWANTAGGSVAYANGALYTMGTASVALYAKWTANTNTITFNGNTNTGGSTASQNIATDATANLTTNGFTKTGYTFAGWNTLANGTGTNYSNNASYTMGTVSVILYAKWTANTNTITFNGNTSTGGATASQNIATDVSATLTSNGFTKTGYTFAGWATTAGGTVAYVNGATYLMGTASVALYAKWTIITYTVAGSALIAERGDVTGSGNVNHGGSITLTAVAHSGYNFFAWDGDCGGINPVVTLTNITANKTCSAIFSSNVFISPIISNIDHGTPTKNSANIRWDTDLDADSEVEYGTTSGVYGLPTTSIILTRDHLIQLTGLSPATTYYYRVVSSVYDGEIKISDTGVENSFTTAAAITSTVSFNVGEGTLVDPIAAVVGAYITPPTPPTRAGYVFGGWYKNSELTTLWDFATDKVTTDTVLYANWNYWISGLDFTPLEGKFVYSVDVGPSDTFSDGTIIGGVSPSGIVWKNTSTAPTGGQFDTGLDANWTAQSSLVADNSIDFVGYPARDACKVLGGRLPTSVELLSIRDNKTSYNNNFQTSNYWASTGFGSYYSIYAPFSSGSSDYSSFNNTNNVRCISGTPTLPVRTVKFSLEPGWYEWTLEQTVSSGSLLAEPVNPFISGYTFAGWYTDEAYTNIWDFPADKVTSNMVLNAKWTANTNTITFNGNTNTGGSTASQNIDTDASAALTSNGFTKTGYTFAGWNTLADGTGTDYAEGVSYKMGTENITLYAKWTALPVETVNIGTQVWASKNLNVGTMTTASSTPLTTSQKWCYDNDEANCDTYGGLYNWDAAMAPREVGATDICPIGFHVPSDTEWTTLTNYLGPDTAGTQLKEGGTSGFEGKLAGGFDGSIFSGLTTGNLWSGTVGSVYVWSRFLTSHPTMFRAENSAAFGFSVRCLQDTGIVLPTYTVSATSSPSDRGSVAVSVDTVSSGGSSTITATANNGYSFFGWSGDCNSGANPYTFNNITADKTCTALFSDINFGMYTISNLSHGTPTRSTANIRWDTDTDADSVVNYGTTSGDYSTSLLQIMPTKDHLVQITGLAPATTYYYQVSSSVYDGQMGGSKSSEEDVFTTAAAATSTVSFNVGEGTLVDPIAAVVGAYITPPTPPTRAGYVFGGWYKNSELTILWDFLTDTVTTDTVLYASWNLALSEYGVTYNSNGGSETGNVTGILSGTTITEPAEPTRNGYTFNGWFHDVGLTDPWIFDFDTVTEDTTLYAKWTSAVTYTVTFNSKGGSAVPPITGIILDAYITIPTVPTRSGYIFDGWYVDDSTFLDRWRFQIAIPPGGVLPPEPQHVTADTTLYAKWTAVATPTPTPTTVPISTVATPTPTTAMVVGVTTLPAAGVNVLKIILNMLLAILVLSLGVIASKKTKYEYLLS
ncbi:MAG: InlB B-repeat-containing protein [bacterium]